MPRIRFALERLGGYQTFFYTAKNIALRSRGIGKSWGLKSHMVEAKERPRHSKKVRALSYSAIAVMLLAAVLSVMAWDSNIMVLYQTAESMTVGISFVNSTGELSLTIPVKGGGFLPVTVIADLTLLDSQNQTVANQQSTVTVSPGEAKDLTIALPASALSLNGSSPNDYELRLSLQLGSLFNLAGARLETTTNLGVFLGGMHG